MNKDNLIQMKKGRKRTTMNWMIRIMKKIKFSSKKNTNFLRNILKRRSRSGLEDLRQAQDAQDADHAHGAGGQALDARDDHGVKPRHEDLAVRKYRRMIRIELREE